MLFSNVGYFICIILHASRQRAALNLFPGPSWYHIFYMKNSQHKDSTHSTPAPPQGRAHKKKPTPPQYATTTTPLTFTPTITGMHCLHPWICTQFILQSSAMAARCPCSCTSSSSRSRCCRSVRRCCRSPSASFLAAPLGLHQ